MGVRKELNDAFAKAVDLNELGLAATLIRFGLGSTPRPDPLDELRASIADLDWIWAAPLQKDTHVRWALTHVERLVRPLDLHHILANLALLLLRQPYEPNPFHSTQHYMALVSSKEYMERTAQILYEADLVDSAHAYTGLLEIWPALEAFGSLSCSIDPLVFRLPKGQGIEDRGVKVSTIPHEFLLDRLFRFIFLVQIGTELAIDYLNSFSESTLLRGSAVDFNSALATLKDGRLVGLELQNP